MKRLGKIAACLAGGLALNAGLRADELAMANNPSLGNPYSMIAVRNVFGLNPPAPPTAPEDPAKDLPKITLTGIQSRFGELEALYKVVPAKPGQAKVDYYALSQGQRQDDIEVVHIDQEKGVVAFNNHGFPQELPLAEASPSGGGAASASAGGMMNPTMSGGGFGGGGNGSGGGFTQFGAEAGANNGGTPNSNPGSNNGGNPNSANGGLNFGSSTTQNRGYQPEDSKMTAEESQALLILNHLKAQTEGSPTAKLFPPTPHDQEAGINPNSH